MELTTYVIHESDIIGLDVGVRMVRNKYGQEIGWHCSSHLERSRTDI
jgi:hypothetical protein